MLGRALLLAVTTASLLPAAAAACGMPLGANVPSEQALITYADGREEIVASLALEDAGPNAAVVFPVPADAEVDVLEGDASLFGYLANVTNVEEGETSAAPVGTGPPRAGVEVVGRDVIGGYDVTRLRADDPRALREYLDANGHSLPDGAEPILAEYVDEGWAYVAIKLAEPSDGPLRPLRIAFPSDEIVYPKRLDALADEPIATTIYVLADQRVEIDRMREQFSGRMSELAAPPPEEFRELLGRADHLTKLTARGLRPEQLREDFRFELATGRRSWTTYAGGLAIGLLVAGLLARRARRRHS